MKLHVIEAGNFKLDGGAMFGVVPKSLWTRTNPCNENNQIQIASRCLLIEDKERLILIDTGMGDKQSDKFFSYYNPYSDFNLLTSLAQKGFIPNDITDVFLTHLHFDHVGGAVIRDRNTVSGYALTFPKARYWTNASHWQWAINPNPREKASFLKENIIPIQKSGNLHHIDLLEHQYLQKTTLGFDLWVVDGHTEKQMLPMIYYKEYVIVFMADLLPTVGHIPLPYVMSYDTRPLQTLVEKDNFLKKAADESWLLFLEHDPQHQIITVKHTEKGVRLDKVLTCQEIFAT